MPRNMRTKIAQTRLAVLDHIHNNLKTGSITDSKGSEHYWREQGVQYYAYTLTTNTRQTTQFAEMWDILEQIDNKAIRKFALQEALDGII